MAKIGRPARLIAYDTDLNIKRRQAGQPNVFNLVRARTILYAGIIAIVGAVMLYALTTRHSESISAIHDRNPMFVRLSDGALRNGYTIRIVNKRPQTREFYLALAGLSGSLIDFVGMPTRADGRFVVEVGPDQTREVRLVITDYGLTPPASTPITFHLYDAVTGERASTDDHFFGP
jgi:polyferredoxin